MSDKAYFDVVVPSHLVPIIDRAAREVCGALDFEKLVFDDPQTARRLVRSFEKGDREHAKRHETPRQKPRAKAKSRPLGEKGMVQLPTALVRDPSISSNELRVFALVLTRDWSGGGSWESHETMASCLGCSSRTIRRILDDLVHRGYVTVERRGVGKTNVYRVAAKYRWQRT